MIYDLQHHALSENVQNWVQSQSGLISAPDGRLFKFTGTMRSFDKYGNSIIISCANAKLYNDPTLPPADNAQLPADTCILQQVDDANDIQHLQIPQIFHFDATPKAKALSCWPFQAYYAPPLVWSKNHVVVNAIGEDELSLKVTSVAGEKTQVLSVVSYFSTSNMWQQKQFVEETDIKTGNAAASVLMKFKGVPTGVAVRLQIC